MQKIKTILLNLGKIRDRCCIVTGCDDNDENDNDNANNDVEGDLAKDLDKIHQFISDFAEEVYGKMFLVKLPFDVPTNPLIKSNSEYINRNGGNSFLDFTVPECVVKFRQGFGRLIRTTRDEGKFICLDNRIVKKKYIIQ